MYKTRTILSQKLSYYDFNEQLSKIIVLIHGNSLSAELFNPLIKSPLLSEYRVIAIELPGHGKSKPSSDPEKEYSVMDYINLVVALINNLELKEYALLGHSLGGHIAINTLPRLNGLSGLAITGTPPLTLPPKLEACFLPNPAMGLAFKPDLNKEEMSAFPGAYTNEDTQNIEKVINAIREADSLVRAFIGKSIATELINDETQLLKHTDIPVAIIQGENDKMANTGYIEQLIIPTLWKNKVHILKDAAHCPFIDNVEAFNAVLAAFLTDCFQQYN
jgi:pimeloyl-ACP methyl ester carboxylesterase